ncbi:unnamed protein product [Wickerhamomyces anomalus]
MTIDNSYETEWVPKITSYRQQLDSQLEPYKHLVKAIDPSKDQHFNAVQQQAKLLTPKELEITNYTAKELISKQLQNELTAVEIYNAFAKRGAIAHIFTNCAMELFFDEGLQRAKALDQYRETHNGELMGPLHGIPISLKELMKYGGKVTTAGYVCYLDNLISKAPRDESISIQILRKLGAVFYMRTSQPQSVMHLDTDNQIIGRTSNPFNYKISPGGSSGGESAAVALGSSVMGIGSDIGGSIRVPAAFCGLYGIRPTTRRVSGMNSLSGGAGQESILSSQGPLTRSIEDLEYYMDAYINKGKPWEYDPNIIPLNWRNDIKLDKETVTFGFIMTDTLVDPSDSIKRGLEFVQSKLSQYNDGQKCIVKIIKLDHDLMETAFKQNKQIYGTSKPVHDELFAKSGEPLLPLTKVFLDFANPMENDILTNNNVKEQTKFYFHNLMEDEGLDFIISPTYANVAEVPKNINHWFYSSMFNLIDFPNIIFGTGLTHDASIDLKGPGNVSDYNPSDYVNAPISLQLTGKRFDDEKLVQGVKLLNKALGITK